MVRQAEPESFGMPENSSTPVRRSVKGPVTTYVYRFFRQDGTLLYVGVTKDLNSRFQAHQNKPWWPQAAHSTVEAHGNRALALAAEASAILDESPLYNVQRPTPAKAAGLRAMASGSPSAELSPYDPVAILNRAHARIDSLEADLRSVRSALTEASADRDRWRVAAAKARAELESRNQQSLIGELRRQLAESRSALKKAEDRAARAERRAETAALKRIISGSRPAQPDT